MTTLTMKRVMLYSNDDLNLTIARALSALNTSLSESSMAGQNLAVIITLICFSVLGSLGNALVIMVYGRIPTKDSSKIFILALACTDLFACLVIIPFTATYLYLNVRLRYDELCKLYQFLITSDIPLSAFLMVTIAFDRYFSICHPFLRLVTPRRAKIALVFPFVTACILGSLNSLSHGVYQNVTRQVSLTEHVEMIKDASNTSRVIPCSSQGFLTFNNKHAMAQGEPSSDGSSYLCENSPRPETTATNISETTDTVSVLVYTNGYCILSTVWYSKEFYLTYQKVYASFFLFSLLVVFALYIKIYCFVAKHRLLQKRNKETRIINDHFALVADNGFKGRSQPRVLSIHSLAPVSNAIPISLVCHPVIGMLAHHKQTQILKASESEVNSSIVRRYFQKVRSLQDVRLTANVRTAAILAVVAVVFTLCFLPSWLMAIQIIPFQMNIFYLYFLYNVGNPIIYAFMNPTFRKEMVLMVQRYYHHRK